MKQKLLFFFLTAFLSLIGGGELWAGAHTVVFNYDEDGLLRTQFTRATEGNSTTIVSSPITLTFISTSERSVNTDTTLGQMKFEGAQKNANNGSSLQVSCSSNALITSISFTSAAPGNVNNFTQSTGTYTAESSSTIGTWTGSETSVTFTTENGNVDKITSISVTYSDVVVEYSDSYPYTWDFTNWETTASTLESDANWSNSAPYAYQTSLLTAAALQLSSGELKETKGLKFENDASTRIVANPDNYLQMYSTVIVVPSLKKGHVVTFTTKIVSGNTQKAQISVSGVDITRTTSGDKYVFTYNAVTDGDVRFNVQALAGNPLQILSIAVEKGEFTMSLNSTDLNRYAGTKSSGGSENNTSDPGSMADIESIVYDAAHPYIRMKLNLNKFVQSEIGVAKADYATYFKATNSSDATVLDVSNSYASQVGADADQSKSGKGDRVYIYDVKMLKPGESNLTFKFVGGDNFGYAEKEITTKVVITKKAQTLSFAEEIMDVNYGEAAPTNTLTQTPAVGGGAVTYSSSDDDVATWDAEKGELIIKGAGTCIITATAAETNIYESASASYILTVNGTQNPTIAWNASSDLTQSGDIWTAKDLPYGNHKKYTAYVSDADESGVTNSDIRYGLVEGSEGYLTIDTNTGQINPTRKFADEDLTEKVVEVYAYIPAGGSHNAAPRITYQVKIVKGTFSDDLFKENELNVNVGHTIAPKNNLQSMRWEDIDAITVTLQSGESSTAVPGTGESTVTDYKLATKATYFDTKTATSGDDNGKEIVDWFYPIFKGLAVGTVTYRVTMSSSLYGDLSGDITLHVLEEGKTTGFAWADGTQSEYTIYEGDYMLLPEITGNTNGNFSYSSGYDNQNTHHKYVYSRRWNSGTEKYETTYNNRNFHKGEGFPNFDLTSDAEGNTAVTEVKADGSNVALLFWNTGTGTEHDQLLIYGNNAGTVYLKAFDPQITTRALSTIKIVVKSKTDINEDFESLKSSMTFPYTWDFTTNYDWSTEIETGTGNWIQDESTYDLGMSSNINYDYADEDKDGIVWGNDNNDPNTNSSELTDKLLVGKGDKVLRGFAGMKIRLGNNGTGSWYSKRDGIHILPYNTNSNTPTPRLRVTTGTHTLILPTPTGENCPATFKVFVKAKALAEGEGTLWVRNASLARDHKDQNKYHDFKSASAGQDIIYSVNATKDTPLELDLDKVDIYWIAFSTEAKNLAKPGETTTYYASTYSYPKGLDINKSQEANPKVTAYYASAFNSSDAVTMSKIASTQSEVQSSTGMLLKATTDPATNPGSLYMIAAAENINGEKSISGLLTNYLKANLTAGSVMPTTGDNTNFVMTYRYKRVHVDGTVDTEYTNGDWSFYRPVPTGATIGANAAYLQVPGDLYVMSAASRRAGSDDDNRPAAKQQINIIFDDDPSGNTGTTEINDISNNVGIGSDAWYTLQGVRVEAPTKGGIYIHNGRKVVIK